MFKSGQIDIKWAMRSVRGPLGHPSPPGRRVVRAPAHSLPPRSPDRSDATFHTDPGLSGQSALLAIRHQGGRTNLPLCIRSVRLDRGGGGHSAAVERGFRSTFLPPPRHSARDSTHPLPRPPAPLPPPWWWRWCPPRSASRTPTSSQVCRGGGTYPAHPFVNFAHVSDFCSKALPHESSRIVPGYRFHITAPTAPLPGLPLSPFGLGLCPPLDLRRSPE